MPVAKKPAPRTVSEVCTVCGLDWKRHGTNPSIEKCVTLLVAEVQSLRVRPTQFWNQATGSGLIPTTYTLSPPQGGPSV